MWEEKVGEGCLLHILVVMHIDLQDMYAVRCNDLEVKGWRDHIILPS